MSSQETASLTSSSYSWRKTSDTQWQRKMAAAELYMYAVSSDGVPRLKCVWEDDPEWSKNPPRVNENAHIYHFTISSILPTIRVKVKTPTERSVLSSRLRSAWKAVYFQVPNATYSGVPASGTNSFDVVYEQNATTASADEWVSKTYGEQDYASSDDIDDILGRELGDIGRRRLQRELGNTVFLRTIFFHETSSSTLVSEFGLIAFVEHFAFDGTGTYNLLSKVLENAVNGVDLSNSIKARPEPPFFDYLDNDIIQGEHPARLAKITDNFMSQFRSLRVSKEPRPREEVAIMGEARNVFSETETTALLRKAKTLGVTISQLAQAAHLVALFSQFPAERTSQVCFTGLLNIRATAGIAVPHYGNATAPFFDTISCADLGERICKSQIDEGNKADASALYNASLVLTQQTQDRQRMALVDAVTVDKFVKQILETPDDSAPVPDPPLSVIADGLLERYIQRRYSGKQLDLTVEDAHLILQDPCPVVQARTATFGGRLSLSLAYNSHVYERATVVGMVQCWADALRYCLREESGRE